MTCLQISQLSEMLDPKKVRLKMSKQTHKYIISISMTVKLELMKDEDLPGMFHSVNVQHDDEMPYQQVEFVPTFTPRIRDGFTLQVVTP